MLDFPIGLKFNQIGIKLDLIPLLVLFTVDVDFVKRDEKVVVFGEQTLEVF